MKTGYFDCFSGASGDMILACLFDLGFETSDLLEGVAGLGLEGVEIGLDDVIRRSVRAKAVTVEVRGDQPLRTHRDIVEMIDAGSLPVAVKESSKKTFDILAEAEGRVHGIRKEDVHFHEVGAVDSLVDVVGAFIGLERLEIEDVIASPLALGTGSVECQHGTLPVPAPATVEIAKGLPVRGWQVPGELTTPTGAAILKARASAFGPVPQMKVVGVGYGAGSRDLEQMPNVMRLIVGETEAVILDRVTLVETNIDDMNPEYFSHLYDDLFSIGALDVWVTQVIMKKGRPGFVMSVLAERPDVPALVKAVLSGTTTSGVRLAEVDRFKLDRSVAEVETGFGKVKVKVFTLDSMKRCAPEYEDCLRVSRARGVSIDEVIEDARNAFRRTLRDR
jgi:uncharacterized protein (TIGR00299 family) protein